MWTWKVGWRLLSTTTAGLFQFQSNGPPEFFVTSGLIVEGNGSRQQIGRLAIWDGSIDSFVHQNHLIKVRLLEPLLGKWILYWLLSPAGRGFVEVVASSTSGLYTLSVNKVADLPIAIPPLREQKRLVEQVERRFSVADALKVVAVANLWRRHGCVAQSCTKPSLAVFRCDRPAIVQPATVSPQRRHFARAVLSAEIVSRLHREPTFGRIKHQKIFHLCEHVARLDEIQGEYYREAAGPLDNRLIYANEAELKKQHWFKTVRRDGHGHCYEPMAKVGGHRKYADRYWPTQFALIERLIQLMRTWKTDRCEIFSTVYAAWNDLILWQRPVTDDAVVHEIFNRWHSANRQIPEARWRKAIQWVRENGFEPTGFGRPQPAQNEQHGCEHSSEKMTTSAQLVQKLWNYCNVLRDDGLWYGDYLEQLTFLLFLKMADEQVGLPSRRRPPCRQATTGRACLQGRRRTRDALPSRPGNAGQTYGNAGHHLSKAQNKIQDPAKLRRLIVDLIDKEQWTSLSADVKGDAYEGLLQKNAEDVKGGAGQYFTPRPLIAAMVDVVAPQPGQSICDPACGTGGFLLAAHDYIVRTMHSTRRRRDG